MEFRFKKILDRGDQKVKFIGFNGVLDYHSLPREYTSTYPRMYKRSESCIGIYTGDGVSTISNIGDNISREHFDKIISLIRECGDRLHEINKKLKKQNENWKGEFSVLI
jgi:hypothetical protein